VANGPVAADVDGRLHDRGVVVVPDVLANAGGVTVSWFEWVQNRQGFPWTLEEVHQRLAATMTRAFDETWGVTETEGVSLRSAAYGVAFRRLDDALAALGTRAYFRGESTA
jgi:glutamate dehydrogenase (NADP+)